MRFTHLLRRICAGAAAAAATTGALVAISAAPASADGKSVYCPDGNFNWKTTLNFSHGGVKRGQILIDDINYGLGGSTFYTTYRMAIKDTYADGYPPYFYLKILSQDNKTYYSPWNHNRLAAKGGWMCYDDAVMMPGGGPPVRVEVIASVNNAPSIPEKTLHTKRFPGW